MLGFCILAPMGDAVAKLLGERMPLGVVLFARFAIQALILLPFLIWGGRAWRMSGKVLSISVLRTVLHIFGIGLMFAALKVLPLADAVAIVFVMPMVLLLFGWLFLHETVGPRRVVAVVAGFVGTLMVIQPAFADVGWAAFLPLGVAVNFAVFILLTRRIAAVTDPIGLQAVSGGMATVLLLPVLFLHGQVAGLDAAPLLDWGLLAGIGIVGSLSHLLMVWSLRHAPAATLAPMQYLEIPIAVLIGVVLWNERPDGLAAIGIAVTCAAGLWIIWLERQSEARKARMPVPGPAPQGTVAAE